MNNPKIMLQMQQKRFKRVRETMRVQKSLLKELSAQGLSAGEAAWFFNYMTLKAWR